MPTPVIKFPTTSEYTWTYKTTYGGYSTTNAYGPSSASFPLLPIDINPV